MLANKLPENHLAHVINPHNSDYLSSVIPSPCCSIFIIQGVRFPQQAEGLGGNTLLRYKRSVRNPTLNPFCLFADRHPNFLHEH